MNINIDLTHFKNVMAPDFHWLLTDEHRYQILVGGGGSGKSWSVAMTILFKILRDFDKPQKHHVLCLRKTSPAARRSLFELFRTLIDNWGLESLCKVNHTNMTITFLDKSTIVIAGLDDESKLKSIEALTAIWLEEVSEHTRDTWLQCDLRLRGRSKLPYIIYMTFNPVSKNLFVYKDFFEKENPNAIIHKSNYKNNPWIDEIYKQHLESLIDQDLQYWRVYCCGEFGELENLIFNNWEIIDKIPERYVESEAVYGADWGYVHKTAIVKLIRDEKEIYIQEKFYKSKKTNMDVINWIKNNLPEESVIYADSAEPARISEARQEGLNMRDAKKGKNSIKDSIDFVKRYKLLVTKDSIGLIAELESYKWREDRQGNVLEEPVKFNDDAIAAMRYGIYSRWSGDRIFGYVTANS